MESTQNLNLQQQYNQFKQEKKGYKRDLESLGGLTNTSIGKLKKLKKAMQGLKGQIAKKQDEITIQTEHISQLTSEDFQIKMSRIQKKIYKKIKKQKNF